MTHSWNNRPAALARTFLLRSFQTRIDRPIVGDSDFVLPPDRQLTLAAYESSLVVKAFCEMIAVGVALPSMPLILEPDAALQLPLELCYARAFAAVPKRWRDILEPQP